MKLIILTSLLLFSNLISLKLVSQEDYLPEGRNWCTSWYSSWSDSNSAQRVGICGDTIVNDTLYKKLMLINDWSFGQTLELLRQEDQKIWRRLSNQEFLMYDFSLEVGDTLSQTSMIVTEVSVISYFGQNRKTISFSEGFHYERWIEGIGSSAGFQYPGWDYNPIFDADSWHCRTNDWNITIHSDEDQLNCSCPTNLDFFCQFTDNIPSLSKDLKVDVYPIPSSRIFTIECNFQFIQSQIKITKSSGLTVDFDIFESGNQNKLTLDQPKGIYILHIWNETDYITRKIVVN